MTRIPFIMLEGYFRCYYRKKSVSLSKSRHKFYTNVNSELLYLYMDSEYFAELFILTAIGNTTFTVDSIRGHNLMEVWGED